jgi:hypothetical protein
MNNDVKGTSPASIGDGEIVLIGTDHYKRVGDKLINLNNSNDVRDINGGSLLDVMIEGLNILKG